MAIHEKRAPVDARGLEQPSYYEPVGDVIEAAEGMHGGRAATNTVKQFAETSTVLGISEARNGATRDSGSPGRFSKFRAFASADQAGTLKIEQSADGTTWYETKSQAVSANTPVHIEDNIVLRYQRSRYVNGATAQGSFRWDTALVAL